MTQQTFWERDGHFLQVDAYEVRIGDNANAGSCSHKAFLAGEYQDLVKQFFDDEVLQQVIVAVQEAKKPLIPFFQKAKNAELQAKRDEDTDVLRAWKRIPTDRSLCRLAEHPDVDAFKELYAKGPESSTVAELEPGVTLTLKHDSHSFFTFSDGSKKELQLMNAPALGYNGYAYVAGNALEIFNNKGERVFTTGNIGEGMYATHALGSTFRIHNVMRSGDIILVGYTNSFLSQHKTALRVVGKRGVLRVDPVRGIVSRGVCAKE